MVDVADYSSLVSGKGIIVDINAAAGADATLNKGYNSRWIWRI